MTSNEEFIRAVYRTAEGDVLDPEGWRASFTEDAVFNVPGAESFTGEALGNAVTFVAGVLPDVHRELLRVTDMGNLVAVEVLIQGTHLGPFPTPAGPIAPTGAKVNVPAADFFYLRDGKIETYNSYVMQSIWFAQLGVRPDFAAAVAGSVAVVQGPAGRHAVALTPDDDGDLPLVVELVRFGRHYDRLPVPDVAHRAAHKQARVFRKVTGRPAHQLSGLLEVTAGGSSQAPPGPGRGPP